MQLCIHTITALKLAVYTHTNKHTFDVGQGLLNFYSTFSDFFQQQQNTDEN